MVVPHSYLVALLMTVLTMICWGSWANVVKLVKNWRFELLYYDYALGILLTAALAGFTLGSMGSYGRPFLKDLMAAGATNIAFGFIGGRCLQHLEYPGRRRNGSRRAWSGLSDWCWPCPGGRSDLELLCQPPRQSHAHIHRCGIGRRRHCARRY